MRNFGLMLMAILGLASCASLQKPLDETYSERLEQIDSAYESARVTATTPWVSDELADPRYISQFERDTCGLPADLKHRKPSAVARCHAKLRDTFAARIAQQYPRINENDLDLQCNTSPERCRDFRIYESWARSSQNETLEGERNDRIAELNRWRDEQEEKSRKRAEEMAGVGSDSGGAPDRQLVQDSTRAPAQAFSNPQNSAPKQCPSGMTRHYNWWTAFCVP